MKEFAGFLIVARSTASLNFIRDVICQEVNTLCAVNLAEVKGNVSNDLVELSSFYAGDIIILGGSEDT